MVKKVSLCTVFENKMILHIYITLFTFTNAFSYLLASFTSSLGSVRITSSTKKYKCSSLMWFQCTWNYLKGIKILWGHSFLKNVSGKYSLQEYYNVSFLKWPFLVFINCLWLKLGYMHIWLSNCWWKYVCLGKNSTTVSRPY